MVTKETHPTNHTTIPRCWRINRNRICDECLNGVVCLPCGRGWRQRLLCDILNALGCSGSMLRCHVYRYKYIYIHIYTSLHVYLFTTLNVIVYIYLYLISSFLILLAWYAYDVSNSKKDSDQWDPRPSPPRIRWAASAGTFGGSGVPYQPETSKWRDILWRVDIYIYIYKHCVYVNTYIYVYIIFFSETIAYFLWGEGGCDTIQNFTFWPAYLKWIGLCLICVARFWWLQWSNGLREKRPYLTEKRCDSFSRGNIYLDSGRNNYIIIRSKQTPWNHQSGWSL